MKRTAPGERPPSASTRSRRGALLALLPLVAFLATFGAFFLDKNREARTVFGSTRGLLTVGVIVGGYLVGAMVLRRLSRWQWLPPVALSLAVLALAAWIVRPYYVDQTANRTLVATPVVETAPLPAAPSDGQGSPPAVDPSSPPPAPPPSPPPAPGPVRLSSGSLVGIDHTASGAASLIRSPDGSLVVRFESFDIEGSPDPQVYLAPGPDVRRPDGTKLGPLPGNQGDVLDFAVPAGTDAGAGWTVLVWCGRFAVPIANATQTPV